MRNSSVMQFWLVALLFLSLTACGGSSKTSPQEESPQNSSNDTGPEMVDPDPADQDQDQEINREPEVNLSSRSVLVGQSVELDASNSSDSDGDELSFSWMLVASPPGSNIFDVPDSGNATMTFLPDVVGTYRIQVSVSDGNHPPVSSVTEVYVSEPVDMLDFRPVDAEYSKALDSIVFVASEPNRLLIVNPRSLESTSIPLNLPPTAVSVGPNGQQAVVGHDAYVSHVDLVNATLLSVHTVSASAGDIVLAGNDHAYVFPSTDQWEGIHSLQLSSGLETIDDWPSIYAGTKAKLHPNGQAMYGADNGLSPSDLERYDITGGTAQVLYDSPYHGDYEVCGDIWISEDGQRLFTRCGNVFRAGGDRESDMIYNGSFDGVGRIQHLDHSSEANLVALVTTSLEWWESDQADSTEYFQLFEYDFLQFSGKRMLPRIFAGTNSFKSFGDYVFFSRDGTEIYLILRADPESALLNDFALWSSTLD